VRDYGADSMRLYEMFLGPLEVSKPWNTRGILGVKRFLDKAWRLLERQVVDEAPAASLERTLHKTIRKVGEDLESLSFNTAISALMVLVGEMTGLERVPRRVLEAFVLLLAPFAPHLAEELWERLGHGASLAYEPWPAFDPALTEDESVEIVFQVNGKVRDKRVLPTATPEAELLEQARSSTRVAAHLEGKTVVKEIVVPGKLVNIVVR
jgi:leucyl-tRNA synthetase